MTGLMPIEQIERKIFPIRGSKVMLAHDLAHLYGVEVRALIQAVKRNIDRFPADFTFQLTEEELEILKSQAVISRSGWGGSRRALPYAFTEQGIAMISSVLHSHRAIAVNVMIMRTFVRLRQVLSTHKDLARKLEDLEKKIKTHDRKFKKQDRGIKELFEAIWELMNQPKTQIGFKQ